MWVVLPFFELLDSGKISNVSQALSSLFKLLALCDTRFTVTRKTDSSEMNR